MGYGNQFYITKDLIYTLYDDVISSKLISLAKVNIDYTADQINRTNEVQKLHYSLSHPSDENLIETLTNGVVIGTRLTAKDIKVYRNIFGPCPGCLAGKTTAPSYNKSQVVPPDRVGEVVHVDIVPFSYETLGGNNYFLLILDDFSNNLHAIPMKHKTKNDLSIAFTKLINYFKSFDHTIKHIHSDSDPSIKCLKDFLGDKNILLDPITPYQHEQKNERYKRTINDKMRSILFSITFKLPVILFGELLLSVIQSINWLSNSNHATISPSTILRGPNWILQYRSQ